MTKLPGLCPHCDGDIDGLALSPWGQQPPRGTVARLAPFICSWCGSLLIIDRAVNMVFTLDEAKAITGVDPLEAMKANPVLWATIEKAREVLMALANRRPVLR